MMISKFLPRIFSPLILLVILSGATRSAAELGIAGSGRHFTLDGAPFLWLGDTAWLLVQLPSREELELYLRTRAQQGFTVIQFTAVMGEERVWGTARATSLGDTPFVENDVLKPAVTRGSDPADSQQYDYWDHVDHVIDRIHAHGLRAALVTYFVGWRGDGYKFLNKENAYQYGRFLGERYRNKPRIVWLLGGDNVPDTADKKTIWTRVAKGIAEGLTVKEDYSQVLMSYHISGGSSSSQHWHDVPWLDFNMAQTWSAYQDIYSMLQRDYVRRPVKPCGLGEGAYEDGPQYPTKPINALVVRKQACWSWFAGGYHTYGNGNVWHFDSYKAELTEPWKTALNSRGAATLRHVKKFLTDIGWWKYVPDQSLFIESPRTGAILNVAMRSSEGDGIAVYLSDAKATKLRLEKIVSAAKLAAKWVNPATGEERPDSYGGSAGFDKQPRSFAPPPEWEDALLHVKGQ